MLKMNPGYNATFFDDFAKVKLLSFGYFETAGISHFNKSYVLVMALGASDIYFFQKPTPPHLTA
jgi:hypothetical protein